MPYLTPEDLPEGRDCRALLIPASSDWLAIVSGALTELVQHYNWQQQGAVTVDQAVAAMQEMIDAYYEGCNDCELPDGGGSIIRINLSGKVEILQGGEWVVPTEGDYYIPPPEAREGGEPEDQICLAAKNAVNVLHEIYLDLSGSFEGELDDLAAGLSMIGVITFLVGIPVGTIAAGILALGLFGFNILYQALSYLTADLWTEDFEAQIICFLINCASNDAGVVTFDWECFNAQLNSLADDFSLSEVQLRLYLQVGFLLQFIGGVDGLNLAAATTAITDDNCAFCDDCIIFDFREDDGGWVADTYGSWVDGEGWLLNSAPSAMLLKYDLAPFPATVASILVETSNDGGEGVHGIYKYTGAYVNIGIGKELFPGDAESSWLLAGAGEIPNIVYNANADNGSTVYVRKITICFS